MRVTLQVYSRIRQGLRVLVTVLWEKKMETAILGYIGLMEKKMEATILGYIGLMEKKLVTIILGYLWEFFKISRPR